MNHIAKTILSYLDAESLRAAELVSKEWQRMISGERSWKAFIERKVRTDSTWHKLSAHREWVQHLFTPQPDKTHNFYRSLHLRFQNEITRIENNWRNGLYKLTKINCGSNQAKGVYCIQYDADKIVAGLRENTIKIWDRNSLMCTNTLNGHTGSVLCLQFDDKVIISGSSDTTIRTWDIRTGALLKTCIHHEDAVLHLKFEKGIMISCSKVSDKFRLFQRSSPNSSSLSIVKRIAQLSFGTLHQHMKLNSDVLYKGIALLSMSLTLTKSTLFQHRVID